MAQLADNLSGQLLLAMPGIGDPRFERSVIYIFEHSPLGAMGFVVNQPAEDVCLNDILKSLNLPLSTQSGQTPAYVGGPVETGRGFVLHSKDYHTPNTTFSPDARIGMTATLDIMEVIGQPAAPDRSLLLLGYAGWDAGQLDDEMQDNAWLSCDADLNLIFSLDPARKYQAGMARMGIDLSKLSSDQGQA
jgi:putative transcriptional regulator